MQQIIASEEYLNDADFFAKTIEQLVDCAIAANATHNPDAPITGAEINIEIEPLSDRRDMPHVSGRMFLIEETLTDGSHVYNIEIFS